MNDEILPKLTKRTLVDDFIQRFEEMILSGKLKVGEKLPSERDLAARLGVSRPVVHEGLIDLAAKGLITRSNRGGAVINDFRKTGSLAILNSLVSYQDGMLNPQLAESTMAFRFLIEIENARLAARNRNAENLEELHAILAEESSINQQEAELLSDIDFRFHHTVALASGNLFYPLLFNSFKPFYIYNVSHFYTVPETAPVVFHFHSHLIGAIEARDESAAGEIMRQMLEHGDEIYQSFILHPE